MQNKYVIRLIFFFRKFVWSFKTKTIKTCCLLPKEVAAKEACKGHNRNWVHLIPQEGKQLLEKRRTLSFYDIFLCQIYISIKAVSAGFNIISPIS